MSESGSRGARLFGRYAFPPNELGYCGPPGSEELLAELDSGEGGIDLVSRARAFDGAWPYLEALAECGNIADPLDDAVVRAYWVGSGLTDAVDPARLLARVQCAFAGQPGGVVHDIVGDSNCLAHHSFHVFAVYPWLKLVPRAGPQALSVLQQCRIRWGTVVQLDREQAVVRSRPLVFDGSVLSLGTEALETVRWSADGRALVDRPSEDDLVSMHWDWMCDRLTAPDVDALDRCTDRALTLANRYLKSDGDDGPVAPRSDPRTPGGTGAPARRAW
jgi:hypothetical protein